MGRRQIASTICWLLFAILGSVSSVNPNINTSRGNTVKHALGGPPRQPTRVCAQLETDDSCLFTVCLVLMCANQMVMGWSAHTYMSMSGRYVREQKILELPEALRKITLFPAQRLEKMCSSMKKKGRLQVGCCMLHAAASCINHHTSSDYQVN